MRANRERGDHGTENASSCSGPNGDAITERHGATPYGFRFETRIVSAPVSDGEGGTLRVLPRTVEQSAMYYLRGRVETYDDVLARGDGRESILLSNMRANRWPLIAVMDESGGHRWKSAQPFTADDGIVDGAGSVVEWGNDAKHAEYRARKLAEWADG